MILGAVAVHAVLLGALGWLGGSDHAPWLVAAMLAWQIAESAAAPARIETADTSARAIGWSVLAVVASALAVPGGRGWLGGIGLLSAGVALRVWAICTLGPAFLDGLALLPRHSGYVVGGPHPRVRTGPYRLLHHPADLGLLVALIGVASITGSAAASALVALWLAPLLWWRTRAEDRLLAASERRIAHRPPSC